MQILGDLKIPHIASPSTLEYNVVVRDDGTIASKEKPTRYINSAGFNNPTDVVLYESIDVSPATEPTTVFVKAGWTGSDTQVKARGYSLNKYKLDALILIGEDSGEGTLFELKIETSHGASDGGLVFEHRPYDQIYLYDRPTLSTLPDEVVKVVGVNTPVEYYISDLADRPFVIRVTGLIEIAGINAWIYISGRCTNPDSDTMYFKILPSSQISLSQYT